MDQDKLIEIITKEVLKRIQGETSLNNIKEEVANSIVNETINNNKIEVTTGFENPILKEIKSPADVAKYIDHTLLKPDAKKEDFDKLVKEAKEYNFYSVCVNSSWVPYVYKKLRGTKIKVTAVVGFPLGAMTSRAKAFETRNVIEEGASEIDMVLNIGALKSGDLKFVEEDIKAVRRATRSNTILKVILETGFLTDDEKVIACQIAKNAGADFVKTSTGFGKGGATVHDIALMRRTVGEKMGVKASGGVRDFETAIAMIQAGATRIGASSSVAIVTGTKGSSSY